MSCPVCGAKTEERRWHDEVFGAPTFVEELSRCPAGHYEHHYAYGEYETTVAGQEFRWSYSTPKKEQRAIEAKVDAAIEAAKAAWQAAQKEAASS